MIPKKLVMHPHQVDKDPYYMVPQPIQIENEGNNYIQTKIIFKHMTKIEIRDHFN